MWNQKELLLLLTFGYVGFAQWASTWWSKLPLCVLVSENQAADNNPDHQSCASLFEGIMRLLRLLWENVTHDNVTTLATVMIAAFTLTLWLSTRALWQAGERQVRLIKEFSERQAKEIAAQLDIAKESVRAAQKSADAAVASERARLYVQITHYFTDCIDDATAYQNTPNVDEHPVHANHRPRAKISFTNYGKTPCTLVEVATGIVYSETPPDPVWDVKVADENIIAPGLSTQPFTEYISGQMTLGMAKKVRDGVAHIWIFGWASYDDVFEQRQTHRFLQRLIRVGDDRRYVLQAYDHKYYNKST